MVFLCTIGQILMAVCQSVQTFAAAQVHLLLDIELSNLLMIFRFSTLRAILESRCAPSCRRRYIVASNPCSRYRGLAISIYCYSICCAPDCSSFLRHNRFSLGFWLLCNCYPPQFNTDLGNFIISPAKSGEGGTVSESIEWKDSFAKYLVLPS
jgi:hypothetical protein